MKLLLILLPLLAAPAFADEIEFDLDSRTRAKIAKEKVKQGALMRDVDRLGRRGAGVDNGDCGSQNIGNVNTGGRPGAAPREVFVFAPNAINLVNGRGCR